MSEQQSSGGFAKAFVPGLVLGLVIGAFAGATLPSLLSEQKLPEHTGPIPAAGPSDRDSEVMPGGDETASPDELTEETDEGTTPPDEADTDDQTPPDQDEADDAGTEEDDGQGG